MTDIPDKIAHTVIARIQQEHPADDPAHTQLLSSVINTLITTIAGAEAATPACALQKVFEHLIDTINSRAHAPDLAPLPSHSQSLLRILNVMPSDLFPPAGKGIIITPRHSGSFTVSDRLYKAIKQHADRQKIPSSHIASALMNEIIVAVSLPPAAG